MVFSSNIFLFLFLPTFLLCYYITPPRWKSFTILLGSYAFYAWWRVDFLLLFVIVTAWNYVIGLQISHELKLAKLSAKRYLVAGVSGNLLVLAYFKYANFGVSSFNTLLAGLGVEPISMMNVILPIGISFYVFQAISYLVDVYRKDVEANSHFVDFAAFIALFPQLIAGPVIRYKDIADQFQHREHTLDKFSEGVQRFMMGFIKKVFIADSVAVIADAAFAVENPSAADAWLGALAYTAQLYFDFSGYSCMAIGLGLMMGFRFVENFNHPYLSFSITEFWRRWHVSLSNWLKDYLYIPLGGNRLGKWFTYRNLFFTMLLGGLWHGASWTFVIWGAWHGIWLALEKAFGWSDPGSRMKPLRWPLTFIIVLLGWVIFRAETTGAALSVYAAMLSSDWQLSASILSNTSQLHWLILFVSYLVVLVPWLNLKNQKLLFKPLRLPLFGSITLSLLFVVTCLKLSSQNYSPFLYFQF